ncbi:ead/Ea22-like family protein [Pseudomonas aeruginosa]
MTDHAELRRLAEQASSGNWYGEDSQVLIGKHAVAYCNHKVDAQFIGEANPKTILALLDEIDGLRSRLEIDERTPHDGIACRDETIKVLDEKCDRLKVENERLRQGMKGDYDIDAWLDWSKEKERIKSENEALRGALQAVEAEVDGNLRPLTRDLVNMVSGLNNGTHPNDIYDHCDEIERIIGAVLEGATQ